MRLRRMKPLPAVFRAGLSAVFFTRRLCGGVAGSSASGGLNSLKKVFAHMELLFFGTDQRQLFVNSKKYEKLDLILFIDILSSAQ